MKKNLLIVLISAIFFFVGIILLCLEPVNDYSDNFVTLIDYKTGGVACLLLATWLYNYYIGNQNKNDNGN